MSPLSFTTHTVSGYCFWCMLDEPLVHTGSFYLLAKIVDVFGAEPSRHESDLSESRTSALLLFCNKGDCLPSSNTNFVSKVHCHLVCIWGSCWEKAGVQTVIIDSLKNTGFPFRPWVMIIKGQLQCNMYSPDVLSTTQHNNILFSSFHFYNFWPLTKQRKCFEPHFYAKSQQCHGELCGAIKTLMGASKWLEFIGNRYNCVCTVAVHIICLTV